MSKVPDPSVSTLAERIRALAVVTTLFTGFTGLVYEVAWQKYLANLIGSQARAAALILAVFLGGLCVGYVLFGLISRRGRPAPMVALYGIVELGIGIWIYLFPSIYTFMWDNWSMLSDLGANGILADVLGCIALIGVPTILMGSTLPLLTQGLSFNLRDSSPFHAKVYAVNTGGAFLGCLLSGFFLLPTFGLKSTLFIVAPINIIAGLVLLVCAWPLRGFDRVDEAAAREQEQEQEKNEGISKIAACIVAFLAGAYSLGLQVVFMRVIGLTMGSSEYAFSMVVAVFILMLAVGAWKVAGDERVAVPLWVNQLVLFVTATLVYVTIPEWPYWCHVLRSLFAHVGPAFYLYHLAMFAGLCLVLLVPVGAMGSTMPLLFRDVDCGLKGLGALVGRLYSWNTVGCVVGALFMGYLALYSLDLYQVFQLALLLMALSFALVFPWRTAALGRSSIPAQYLVGPGVIVVVLVVAQLPDWNVRRFSFALFREREALSLTYQGSLRFYKNVLPYSRVVAFKDGPNTTVAVTEIPNGEFMQRISGGELNISRSLIVNGKSDGNTGLNDMRTMRTVGHLPVMLSAEKVERAAVIGFGLGVSAGSILLHPEVKEVDCIEISPFVREFSGLFDFANYNASKNPRLNWIVDDAYHVLRTSQKNYQVIVSEPSNPWVTGVERLYAKDFYEIVKGKLTPDGIYAQWMHQYSISEETLGMVIRTFGEVFENVYMFDLGGDLVLLGTAKPLGLRNIRKFDERWVFNRQVGKAFAELGFFQASLLLGTQVPVPLKIFEDSPLHTLEFPKLAYAAGKDFFLKNSVAIEKIFHTVERDRLAREASGDMLIKYWLKGQSKKMSVLKEFALTACKGTPIRIGRSWWQQPFMCRTTLAVMGRNGAIPFDGSATEEDLERLKTYPSIFPDNIQELDNL